MIPDAPPAVRARASEAGFSLLEGLIAAALLVFVLVGILPLFERARLNLLQGNDATNVSNAASDGFDQMLSLPFNSFATNVPATTNSVVTTDVWALYADRWYTAIASSPVPNDQVQYTRTITLDQFQIDDLNDNGLLDAPLSSGPTGINTLADVKRYIIDINNTRTPGLNYRLVVIQSN